MFWNNHTYYSLRYGTLSVTDLVRRAKVLGLQTLGITDINCSTGIFEFVKCCVEEGIRPVAGIEFRNEEGRLLFTALAKDLMGVEEINRLLSDRNLYGKPFAPALPQLQHSFVVYPLANYPATLANHELIGVKLSELNKLVRVDTNKLRHKLILQQPITFADAGDYSLHLHLRSIHHNVLLSRLDPTGVAGHDEYLMSEPDLIHACRHYHFLLTNTLSMLERCSVQFDFHSHKNKKTYSTTAEDDRDLLRKLAYDGLEYRYGNDPVARRRVEKELEIIHRLGFSSYFLITWDIIRYSLSKGFYHVGRGSGANSVVAYCLRITDVDPIELNLYFERFLNPKRTSPPDFDIDYSWKDRPQVHDYIFKRYGREHTALLGTISTFRDSSIYRELGKVYGLPKREIDLLADHPDKADRQSPILSRILKVGEQIQDFPNYRSIHAGGVLISEDPVFRYSALDLPPVGLPTVQWDMHTSETIGFEKFDILSQRGIGHIKEAAEIIRYNRGEVVDVHAVQRFKNDPRIRKELREANSIGCFYIESPAMRGLLRKLRCDTYIHLVAASSIIRPGVAKSGMMKAYIERFHHPDKIAYLHPVMQEQLEETYGVMVFQEDVLKVCHHYAGLDLADADVLRRAMSGKYRSKAEFQRIVDKFFAGCKALGRPEEVSREVWRQVESFAGYSFSKAHSASFAVESFQSLFLKTYYPMEFMVAVINNFGGFYRTWVYVNELKKTGATVHLPCVNRSERFTCIRGTDVFLGLAHLEGLERNTVEALLEERSHGGPFAGLEDFMERVPVGVQQVKSLVKCGAFRFTGMGKKPLLWKAYAGNRAAEEALARGSSTQPVPLQEMLHALLPPKPKQEFMLPALTHDPLEDAYDEIELLGFPVSMSDFDLLQTGYRGDVMARNLSRYKGETVRMVGNYVTTKSVRTTRGDHMAFGTFYDVESNFFDTTHFPPQLKQYPFSGRGVYLIEGKVVEEFGFCSLEVEKLAKLPVKADPRY